MHSWAFSPRCDDRTLAFCSVLTDSRQHRYNVQLMFITPRGEVVNPNSRNNIREDEPSNLPKNNPRSREPRQVQLPAHTDLLRDRVLRDRVDDTPLKKRQSETTALRQSEADSNLNLISWNIERRDD